jgi:hypothetical protein
MENANAAKDDQDSTLNEGWEETGSSPKQVQPKPPTPRKDSSTDDTGDSSCV